MIAYRYDSETKIYVGEATCQLDPIATERTGSPVYLLPANCTWEVPPEPRLGFDIVWNGTAWDYQEIPRPEPQPEPQPPTHDEIRQMRVDYRHDHIDDQTLERSRKIANGTWSEEDEANYLALDAEVTAYIEENFPYPDEEGENDEEEIA